MKKRILSMLLTLCLIAGLLPTAALAAEGNTEETVSYTLKFSSDLSNGISVVSVTDKNNKAITSGDTVVPSQQNPFTITIKHPEGKIVDLGSVYTDESGTQQNGLAMSMYGSNYSVSTTESKYQLWLLDYDHTIVVDGVCDVSVSNSTATISGKSKIPSCVWKSSINLVGVTELIIGNGITGIGANAFQSNSSLAKLSFTTTDLTSIGNFAFYQNYNLTGDLTLPNGLLEIGKQAFDANNDYISFNNGGTLTLPNSLQTIGDCAFRNCLFTGALTLPSSLKSIGEQAFYGQKENMKFSGELVIPSNISTISAHAFRNCKSITSVKIPDSVTEICNHAFAETGITNLIIPDNVKKIGNYAFGDLSLLKSVYIANTDITFGSSPFLNVSADAVFYVPDMPTGLTDSCVKACTNGGTFSDDASFTSGTLATPTKEGYTFGGWYSNNSYSEPAVTAAEAGKTYYAKWVREITFDANGGKLESVTSPVSVVEGAALSSAFDDGNLPTPTRTGYTFNGWYTAAEGGTKVENSTVPAGYTTLYAHWTPNTYTIRFDGNGADSTTTTAEVTATYDTPATLTPNGFEKADNYFSGWATERNGEVVYADGAQVKNLGESSTVTLYAVWSTKPSFTPVIKPQTVTYNGATQAFEIEKDYNVSYKQGGSNAEPKNAGSYDVEISRNEDDTHASYHTIISDGLTITPASLRVKADNQSIYVGGDLPTVYTYTVTGWQGEDEQNAETLLTGISATCADANANTADTYTITVSGPESIENYTINYETGDLTVRTRSGGGGGSSSSNSTTTETTTNPDGSKTTTVTDKKTGTVTETTKNTDGSTLVVETKKDGTVTTTETTTDKVVVKTVDEPGEDVTATVTIPRSVGAATVVIPADTTPGTVAVDAKTGEIVKLSVPTEDGLAVKLDASADLVLMDKSKDFTDTENHWAEDAIDFATAHEMFSGTSATTFSPDSPMTRAMLMTVLARFNGEDTTGGSVWYEKGMEWAKANGVSDGSNPGGSISREQLATMLYRYAGSPDVEGSIDHFSDAGKVSGYADQAMRWAVSSGIIGGMGDGTLNPQGNATRAQVATMLMRFCENLTTK